MILPKKLVCLDIETTDADATLGSIIQLSAVLVDKQFNIIDEFNEYVKPLDNHRNLEASKIHQISEETIAEGLSLNTALELFENFCGKNRLVASYPSGFDWPFLRKQYDKIGRAYPFGRQIVCLKSIAIWEMAKRDILIVGGVKKIAEALNKEFIGTPHNAIDDIKNTVYILQNFK
jgi:DNA polymerase III epsilon subunit-like protein